MNGNEYFDQEFAAIMFRNYTQREIDNATAAQTNAFVSDAVESIVTSLSDL